MAKSESAVFKLPDSGDRRFFKTGSKRDLAEGKGRLDLMPNSIVAELYLYLLAVTDKGDPMQLMAENNNVMLSDVYSSIDAYIYGGDTGMILDAIIKFAVYRYNSLETALLEVARHFEAGAKKYDDRNWEKGQPLHVFVDSGLRHLVKWTRGDQDEPHDSAFLWNMMCLLWTHDRYPELRDLPFNPDYKLGKRE
jgi:hypothetical protein